MCEMFSSVVQSTDPTAMGDPPPPWLSPRLTCPLCNLQCRYNSCPENKKYSPAEKIALQVKNVGTLIGVGHLHIGVWIGWDTSCWGVK